ncbi:hypothetical protein EMGBS1_06520 [Chloroflexota bacterium]|nr:hypothetical protein EMGBS1_06520 [Chloroflexota bacterium]
MIDLVSMAEDHLKAADAWTISGLHAPDPMLFLACKPPNYVQLFRALPTSHC